LFGQRLRFRDGQSFLLLMDEIFISEIYDVALPPAPRIIDCGSNIGASLAYFYSRDPKSRITAFEGDEGNFRYLAANCKINSWTADIHCLALDRTDGEKTWYTFGDAGTLRSGFRTEFSADAPAMARQVRTVPLSRYIDGRVDLLKLDIEGAEHAVIQDLVESGKIGSIDRIVMEYHHHVTPDEDRLGPILCALEKAGFGYSFWASKNRGCVARAYDNFMLYGYRKAVV
jgi:FkbM family methyltransferase